MKTFEIEIIETLSKTVKIKAQSVEDAILKAEKLYKDAEIVLTDNDYIDTTIELLEDNVARYDKKGLIDDILEHFLEDEKKHYEEYEHKPKDHIYLKLKRLKELN